MSALASTWVFAVFVACAPWWLRARAARRRCRQLRTGAPPGGEAGAASVEVIVLLELVAAAMAAGAAVPRALQTCGDAVGGSDGLELRRCATALRLGAPWPEAWRDAPKRLGPVAEALRTAWEDGAAPGAAITAASDDLLRTQREQARLAAAQLGVRLVLPLGVCLLPAFVLVGLVPVLLALGVGLLSG